MWKSAKNVGTNRELPSSGSSNGGSISTKDDATDSEVSKRQVTSKVKGRRRAVQKRAKNVGSNRELRNKIFVKPQN